MTNRARERHSHVDHEVEIHEDTTGGEDGVEDNLGTVLEGLDLERPVRGLLGNKWRNVRLESSSPHPHDDYGDSKASHSAVRVGNNGRNRRDGEEDVTDEGDEDGPADGLLSAEVSLGSIDAGQERRTL